MPWKNILGCWVKPQELGESGQTNSGDVLSIVLDSARTAVDAEHGTDEMSRQRPGDEIPQDDRAQKSQIQELPEPDEFFSLDGTVWGAAAVVGLPGLRISDNLSIATGLAFNVYVQVLFCVIAYQSFSDESFPTVEDVKRWRYTVAHDVTASDSTGVSLADRVCSADASLVVSASQVSLVEEIMQYVSVVDFVLFTAEQGSLLCCVAILIWLLVIMAEWHAAVSIMTAIWMSFDSATQQESMVSFKNGARLKMPVSWYRFFAMLVIVGIRIGIAVALLTVGVQWLLATTSVENIILNAAALGFVMDLDELVYVTMLTAPVKGLLRRIEFHESRFRSGRCFAGRAAFVACFPCFAWLCVAALVAFIVPEVRTNVNTMQELEHYLCGGNRDFVFTPMPSTGIVMIKESEVFEATLVGSYEVKSLDEAVWIQDLRNLSRPWLAPSDSWFAQVQSMTVSEFSHVFSFCWDMEGEIVFTNYLKEVLSLDSWSCGSVPDHCSMSNSTLVRWACANTCGCDNPLSSLYLNGAAYGCTVESCKAQAKYKIALEGIACSTSDVRQHPNWTNLVRNRNAYMIESGTDDEEMMNELMTNGCDAVKYYQEQLCVETLAKSGFSLCGVQWSVVTTTFSVRQAVSSGGPRTTRLWQTCPARTPPRSISHQALQRPSWSSTSPPSNMAFTTVGSGMLTRAMWFGGC